MPDSRPADAAHFAAMATELQSSAGDPDLTAQTIVDQMAELVPRADAVSITVRIGGRHTTLASTHDDAERADDLQYRLDEGPCLDAAENVVWARSGDIAHDERWPRWGPGAAELGFSSLLSVRLLDGDAATGALNVYGRQHGQFTDRDDVDLALVFAAHAAAAMTSARRIANLEVGMRSRHVIGLAQGILMERYQLDEAATFKLLRRLSGQSNLKVRALAAQLVETGRLPSADEPGDDEPRADDGTVA